MPIYRKKPVMIEAIQLTRENLEALKAFVPADTVTIMDTLDDFGQLQVCATVKTLEGYMNASPGDYIIKGVKGEFYPCKPDIFDATYDLIEMGGEMQYADLTACGCRKCRNLRKEPMWAVFVVCPECGNKRCPKASDHELDCTNSNEPGQEGSVY